MLKRPGPIRLAGSSLSVLILAALGSSVLASKEVDPAFLSLTDCPMMPGCPALILLDETEFSNEGSRTKYSRKQLIKVFTQEGIDTYSDVEVRAQSGGWDVRNLEGRTIQPDGTSIPLKQDNIRIKYLRAGKRRERVKSATFPGVVAGSIIEYSYDILTEQNSYMTEVEWEVQQELPTAIPFSAAAKNVFTRETVVRLAADGSADVEVTDQGSGLVDLEHRLVYEELDDAARREKLATWVKSAVPKAELTEAAFEQIDSFEKSAVLKYHVRVPDAAEALADKLILTPSLLHAARPGAFTAEDRVTPVHLPFRRKSQERTRIVAPEGYELDELPAPVVVRDAPLVFTFAFDLVSGELVVSRRVEIDTAVWPAADYSRLKAFYQKLQEADRQVVVFKKASGS